MGPAVNTGIRSVGWRQILLKCLHHFERLFVCVCRLHHPYARYKFINIRSAVIGGFWRFLAAALIALCRRRHGQSAAAAIRTTVDETPSGLCAGAGLEQRTLAPPPPPTAAASLRSSINTFVYVFCGRQTDKGRGQVWNLPPNLNYKQWHVLLQAFPHYIPLAENHKRSPVASSLSSSLHY